MSPLPFLTRLVERATLRAPVLERRPRSLFEPAATGSTVPASEVVAPEATSAMSGGREGPARAESGAGWWRAPAEGESLAPASGDDRRAGAREPVPSPPAVHRGGEAEGRRPAGQRQPPAAHAGAGHGVLELPAPPESARVAAWPTHDGRRPRSLADAARPTSSAPVSSRERRADRDVSGHEGDGPTGASGRRTAHVAVSTSTGGAGAAPLRPGRRLPGPPALLVRAQAGGRRSGADDGPAGAPGPVQITIGRIEVRATAPERPPVRRPAPGPKLTLDDYLNGRRGGAR
jgi:hypothetical protein